MKTTVDLPDELYGRAKAEAALRGEKFRELVAQDLADVLGAPGGQAPKSTMSVLMKRARGVMDWAISDLASDPKHLSGFGRNGHHR